MEGKAYGARSDGSTVATLDVEFPSLGGRGERIAVAVEPRLGQAISERIQGASRWDQLPLVHFEDWQVVGPGR